MEADVLVVGAGVIGLAVAREARRRGASVAVVDRAAPGSGASRAAAGILSPTDPHEWTGALGAFNLRAIRLWDAWARALEAEADRETGYERRGELRVGRPGVAEEEAFVAAGEAHATAAGWAVERVTGAPLARAEPGLAPAYARAVRLPDAAAVRVDALLPALVASCEAQGARIHRAAVTGIDLAARTLALAGGTRARGATVVLSGGAWIAEAWVPEAIRPPVRPVLGESLLLRVREPACAHVVRTAGGSIVPRADGTVWAGTTALERGFQPGPSLGSVRAVAARAAGLLPALDDALLLEARSGLRPRSADGLPFVGPVADGIVLAAGHGREGIIHAPLCGLGVARGITEDDWDDVPDEFRPTGARLRAGPRASPHGSASV